jgi:hypothetical protein
MNIYYLSLDLDLLTTHQLMRTAIWYVRIKGRVVELCVSQLTFILGIIDFIRTENAHPLRVNHVEQFRALIKDFIWALSRHNKKYVYKALAFTLHVLDLMILFFYITFFHNKTGLGCFISFFYFRLPSSYLQI